MASTPYQPGASFGPFFLVRELALGQAGCVFEARDTSRDCAVLLKIVSEELRKDARLVESFMQEAEGLALPPGAHAVAGDVGGVPFLAVDLVEGLDARPLLQLGEALLGKSSFKVPENFSADDVPDLEVPVEKKPAPKGKAKFQPRPEDNVEIDAEVLATEKRKEAIAEAKHTAPRRPVEAVKLAAAADPLPREEQAAREYVPVKPLPMPKMRIFTFKRIFLAALLGGAAYLWAFAGVSDVWVAGAPECKHSAEGLAVPMPYKDIGFPDSFAAYRELGLVCDGQMNCWSRSRPWRTFKASRDHLMPKTPWGDAYTAESLLVFRDPAKHTIRVRNSAPGERVRITLGLEECIFSARPEKVAMLRFYLATLLGDQLDDSEGDSVPSAPMNKTAEKAPTAPGSEPPKKEEAWNKRGWNRFLDFINKGE